MLRRVEHIQGRGSEMGLGLTNKKGDGKAGKPSGSSAWKNILLLICNIILLAAMILTAMVYSRTVTNQKDSIKLETFCNTVESLKKISENYFSTEKGYVDDWAKYISAMHMTADEALEYIRTTNTHSERAAHLVNMDDLTARSTYLRNDDPWIHVYEEQSVGDTESSLKLMQKLNNMFNAAEDKAIVLGKYRTPELQLTVVSVGCRVTIREDDGSDKDYLLLRLIPVEYLQSVWVFPTEFPGAEISLIASDGGYIVASNSMRSSSFTEYIRGYNFQDDYNKVYELKDQLETTDSGLLQYKNSAGKDCYYYYSHISSDYEACILGYIPVDRIRSDSVDWSIALILCGMMLLIVIIDGSHILSINRQLRRAIKTAERANQAKTQFLSSMSHDIRTPMNAVIGMTEIAKHHVDDPEYVKSCLNKVSMSGNHLLTLINDILDISKVESGKMTLNPNAFSLNETIEEMVAVVRQSAADKDIDIKLNVHDVDHDTVVGDALRIRQVIINILINAVKYTEAGGHVWMEVSQRALPDDADNVEVRFVIADNGIGMSEEFQKRMYTSFSRATDSRINTIQGSGLGLAIASRMVELMHGMIDCDSTLGKGTTFTIAIKLPIASELPGVVGEGEKFDSEQIASFAGMRILVAEDNDLNWEIISALLSEYGINAERVENGQMCFERLSDPNAAPYDIVLMDVQMPVMDGREATRHIRAAGNDYMRNIPIVAMTADAFAEDVFACLEAGIDGHVAKPVDINQVFSYLRKVKNNTLRRREG